MADQPPNDARSIDTELEAPAESARGGMPRIGDVVAGRYRIERILGSGGMGVVVEARHTALGELVAIKFLRADARKDPAVGERFLREAKASSQLKGEHVARVHDLGTTEAGHAYLVMEHLTGTDLANLLSDRGALPVGEAVDYVLQACEGLAEAHARGIVHRDLKPSNLFLTTSSDGTALIKLLDFGIAKANTEAHNAVVLTETNAVFGSPAYMSPEQIRSAKNVDARTDIWSLGIVLFELLSATIPFRGESSTAVLAAVAADQPLSLKSVRGEIPLELSNLVARTLEKDPAKRVQTVLELAVALLPFAAGRSTTSVERIRRLSLAPAPDSSPSGRILPPMSALTGRAWATTSPAPSATLPSTKKTNPKRAIIPIALVASMGLAYFGFRPTRAPTPERAPQTAASAPTAPVVEAPPAPAPNTATAPMPASSPIAEAVKDAGVAPTSSTPTGSTPTGFNKLQGRRQQGASPRHTPAPAASSAPPPVAPPPVAPPTTPPASSKNAESDWK